MISFTSLAALSPLEEKTWGWVGSGRFGLREISTASTGIRTEDRPERSPVSIPTALMKNGNVGNINEGQMVIE